MRDSYILCNGIKNVTDIFNKSKKHSLAILVPQPFLFSLYPNDGKMISMKTRGVGWPQ